MSSLRTRPTSWLSSPNCLGCFARPRNGAPLNSRFFYAVGEKVVQVIGVCPFFLPDYELQLPPKFCNP